MFHVDGQLEGPGVDGFLLRQEERDRLADVAVDLDSEPGGELVVGEEARL